MATAYPRHRCTCAAKRPCTHRPFRSAPTKAQRASSGSRPPEWRWAYRIRPSGSKKIARLAPGDYLVLYADGFTEAQNRQGTFFGEERLLNAVLSKVGRTAREMQDALIEEVNRFEGYSLPQDDIALVVIHRLE